MIFEDGITMLSTPSASEALAFRKAAYKDNLADLEKLFAKYGKNILDLSGRISGKTALHQASAANSFNAVNALINWGADVNIQDAKGNTPLILSYQLQSFDAANLLLDENGLDVLCKNDAGENALMTSIGIGKPKKFSLLYDKFRAKLTAQVHELIASGKDIQGIDIKPSGDIILLKLDEEELVSKIQTCKGQVYRSDADEDGGTRAVRNEKGFNFEFGNDHHFKVPPLVFFMAHDDNASFEILQRNFKYLKQMGYKAICLELDSDDSLEQTLTNLSNTSNDQKVDELDRRIASLHVNFIESLSSSGFCYHGVDAQLGVLRISAVRGGVTTSERGMDLRNHHISENILTYANRYEGGVIVLIGAAHIDLLPSLRIANRGTIDPFVLYQAHSNSNTYIPSGDSLEDRLLRLRITEGPDIVCMDCSKLSLKNQQAKFKKPIAEFLERQAPTQVYSEEVSTQLVRKLQTICKDFKGVVRERSEESPAIIVDAVVSVPNFHVYSKQAKALQKTMPLLATKMSYIGINNESSLSLVIEDINGGPNRHVVNQL